MPTEYKHNLNTYSGISSEDPMLLNDEFKGYKLTKNKSPTAAKLQPNNLRNKVKSLLKKSGLEHATFTTFSDSLIVNLYKNNADINKVYSRVPVTGHNK